MLEKHSALRDSEFEGQTARLVEAPDFTLSQVAASDTALKRAFAALPTRVGFAAMSGDQVFMRIGPKQLWVVGPEPKASLPIFVTPLSSSRVRLLLSGSGARNVLAQCAAIDFHRSAFRPGQFAMTGIHHTPVLIHCFEENQFHIYAMRTFGQAVWDWLVDVMAH